MDFKLTDIFAEIDNQAKQFGVDPLQAKALLAAENTASGSLAKRTNMRGDAVSPMGAAGLMQVMPATAAGLQAAGFLPPTWKHDPANLSSQVAAGLAALKEKTGRMRDPNDLGELASIYNGSSKTHRAYKAGEFDKMPGETIQYIQKLRTAMSELNPTGLNSMSVTPTGSLPASTSNQSSGFNKTTRRSVGDPGVMNMFMTDAMGAVQPGGSFDATAEYVNEQAGVRDAANTDFMANIIAAGTAAGELKAAETVTLATSAAKKQAILNAANLNPDRTNNELTRAFDAVISGNNQLERLKPEIDARMKVGLFDNPLEWLVNQTRLPGMVEEYNGIVGTVNAAEARHASLASIANKQQAISVAAEADDITRQGKAAVAAEVAKAAVLAKQLEAASAGANIRDSMLGMQITGQKLGIQGAMLNQTKQTETESEFKSDKAAAAARDQMDMEAISKLRVAAGGKPITAQEFKLLPPAERAVYSSAASTGKFGKDFAESFNFVNDKGDVNVLAQTGGAAMVNWLQGTSGAAAAAAKKMADSAQLRGDKTASVRKFMPEILNAAQEQYQVQAATDMRLADTNNPMKLDYVTIAKDPKLAGNSVAMWVNKYGPKGTNKLMDKVDEQFLLESMYVSVRDGLMTVPQAAKQVEDFYKFGTEQQAARTKYQLFGLSKPFNVTYPVNITGYERGASKVDLGDASAVERLLTMKVANEAAKAMYQGDPASMFNIPTMINN